MTGCWLAPGALAAGLTTLATLTAAARLAPLPGLTTSTTLPGLPALTLLAAPLPWLPVLRLLLAWLTALIGLPVAAELAGLELLAAGLAGTAGLTLPRLRAGTSAQAGELVAQTG